MAEGLRPNVSTIPPHRAFVDALAAGIIARHGSDPMVLARGLVLLPNNRSCRALTDAFVRRAGDGGLLLPRLVAIGDIDLDEAAGVALDGIDDGMAIPAAVDAYARRMMLARLVLRFSSAQGQPVGAAEAVRLSGQLARTLDQLIAEEIPPSRLTEAVPEDVARHWQLTLQFLQIVIGQWPLVLEGLGQVDAPARRNMLFDALAGRWRQQPPGGFVIAAGIATSAPAVSRLLKTVAFIPNGEVVLPGLDLDLPETDWALLGPVETADGRVYQYESHPQFHLKLLLDRMGVNRAEVTRWRWGGGRDAPAQRSRAVEAAMAPAEATGRWQEMTARDRRVGGVRFLEAATPGEEAQAIALAMREALDTPGRTAALITPDRALARRVAAHLQRWNIRIDDSAGQPLSHTPPGAFLALLAEAAAAHFAPINLLALLKHPLARAGDERLQWLEDVRRLDKALRGPRPAVRLAGVSAHLAHLAGEEDRHWLSVDDRRALQGWWRQVAEILKPLEDAFAGKGIALPMLAEHLIAVGAGLAGDALWAGPAGRAASDLVARLGRHGGTLEEIDPAELPALLRHLMDEVAVRPPAGGHPRLAIYGLVEARLQRADLMILGSLNEGVWPALPSPDPWLAPRIRAALGLPGLERRIGLAAHDFVAGLGAPEVLVTRARRDVTKPTVASRLWLRMEAMTGGMPRALRLPGWAAGLDGLLQGTRAQPVSRPAPRPLADLRPRRISVTAVDRLKADPYAFYAQHMLKLSRRDAVDIDPTPADRGNAIHAIMEEWIARDGGRDPALLVTRAAKMLAGWTEHPLLRVLWHPRVMAAVQWAAERIAADLAQGWQPALVEARGERTLAGVLLNGRADRIDRRGQDLRIVDYKTGQPPSARQLKAGFALQLGLLGWLADEGAFGIDGTAAAFEYWRLSGGRDKPGEARSALKDGRGEWMDAASFAAFAAAQFADAAGRYLTGSEPFAAKLHPQYALYSDYDQLARVAEWQGRERGDADG